MVHQIARPLRHVYMCQSSTSYSSAEQYQQLLKSISKAERERNPPLDYLLHVLRMQRPAADHARASLVRGACAVREEASKGSQGRQIVYELGERRCARAARPNRPIKLHLRAPMTSSCAFAQLRCG